MADMMAPLVSLADEGRHRIIRRVVQDAKKGAAGMEAGVTRWAGSEPPNTEALREALADAPYTFATWSDGPADTYATHSHSFDKLLVCLRGSITFMLPATGQRLTLAAGDRLFLPARTAHAAVVGAAGVECAETHLPPR